jgi:hypothetical protein
MPRPPHALDYHRQTPPTPRWQFLFDHHGNFIAGSAFGFSIALIAALTFNWIDRHIVERFAFPNLSIAFAFIVIGLLTIALAMFLFFRRRRCPVGIITGARHGVLAGIGLAITIIGLYFLVLTVLFIAV